MQLKEVKVVEWPYSIWYVTINDFRIGWFGFNGNKKRWGCQVTLFGRGWAGTADSPEEATQMIKDVVEMWLEEMFDA